MASYHIIGGDNKEYGPVPAAELRNWIAQARADGQTKVRAEGTTEWVLLSQVPELADGLVKTPPPLPKSMPLPGTTPPPVGKTSALAVTSLVLGILGFFTCGITALFGLIFGIIALVKISNSQGAVRGRGLALAGTIVSGVFVLLLPMMAMLLPALSAAKEKAQQINCLNNEKQLALAVLMYSENNTNHLPSAANWCDAIKAEVGSDRVFKCPAAAESNRCDYAFNAKLDGLTMDDINPQTVMIFESDGGWNAHGGPELLAAHRHRKNVVLVAFVDGHTEVVQESRLSSLRWNP